LVEDDEDDKLLIDELLKELGVTNQLIWFPSCIEAFRYLQTTYDSPFIILSDVNLPLQNGVEFKKHIDKDPVLRKKSIPFVFLSTSVDQATVNLAYEQSTVQGFFQKRSSYAEMKQMLGYILEYWKGCRHPNSL
jgi:CheY-like chemotaxis protein